MGKPKEFILCQKYQYNGEGAEKVWFASTSKQSLDQVLAGNKTGGYVHVIEKAPVDKLLDEVLNHLGKAGCAFDCWIEGLHPGCKNENCLLAKRIKEFRNEP